MGVLIDASVLIEHERRGLDLETHLQQREEEEFLLSVITGRDLLHGVHRASNAGIRARRAAWLEVEQWRNRA